MIIFGITLERMFVRGLFICMFGLLHLGGFAQSKLSVTITNPTALHVCIASDELEVELRNITTAVVTGIETQIELPTGVTYISGSLNSTGASEKNISDLSKPIFSVSNIAVASAISVKIRLDVSCSIVPFLNNGGLAIVKTQTVYTGGSAAKNSSPLNVKQPSLQIQSISNQLYTADLGSYFVRTITLKNSGTGKLATCNLRQIHQNGIVLVNSIGGSSTQSGDTLFTVFDSTHFKNIGDGDAFFELNETISISDSLQVIKCTNLAGYYKASWGCNAQQCNFTSSSGNVSISSKNPNLVFTPLSYTSNCISNANTHIQELVIYNKGNDTSRALDLHLFQSRGTGFSTAVLSEMEYNSFKYKTSRTGTATSIIPYQASNGGTTGIYACLSTNSMGEGKFKLVNLAPGDSLILSWTSRSCLPTICNSNYFVMHRWKFKASYENQCGQSIAKAETYGSTGLVQSVTMSKFAPTDLLDGQSKSLEYTFSNGYLLRPRTTSQLKVELILPAGLTHSLNAADLQFSHPNGSSWSPNYFTQSGDTINAIFNGPPQATLTRGELKVTLTGDCNGLSYNHDVSYELNIKYNPDTSCTYNGFYDVYCDNGQIRVHCANSCNAGLHFNDFEARRISYGSPDNNNDGLPDATGTLDMGKIKTQKVMFGDTVRTTFRAKVYNAGSTTNWYYGKATSTLDWGTYLSVADVRIKIYRLGNLMINCNNINYSYSVSGNSKTFVFDISYNNLVNSGCSIFSSFSYRNIDSVELEVTYVVDKNPGNAVRDLNFENDFYLSTVANPSSSQKFQCDSFSGKLSLIGYYFTNYGRNIFSNAGCNEFNVSQNFYLSIGNCCSNYGGGNIFPYEYRPWAKLNNIIVHKPIGFDLVSSSVRQYRTAGTGSVSTQIKDPIYPYYTTTDTIAYHTDSLYTDKGGSFYVSDDGFHGTFSARLRANCHAWNGSSPVIYGFIYEKLGGLGTGLDTFWSSTTSDQIIYSRPDIAYTVTNNYVYPEKDTAEWIVRVSNNAATADAEHVWLSGASNGNAQLVRVIDLSTLDTLVANNDVFQYGQIKAKQSRDFKVQAVYQSCSLDSLSLYIGFDCSGYPTSRSNYDCETEEVKLYYEPINTRLEANILDTSSAVDLCEEKSYAILIRNAGSPKAYDTYLDMLLRPGMVLNDSAWLMVDGRSDSSLITSPSLVAPNTYRWEISQQDSLLNADGFNGVKSANGYTMILHVRLKTDCDFTSSSFFLIKPGGYLKCGSPVNASFTVGDPIDIKGVSKPYFSAITHSMTHLDACNYVDSSYISFINLGPDTTGITDQIIISMPQGVYVDTTVTPTGHNAPTSPATYELLHGENVFSFKLPSGIQAGDSVVFKVPTFIDNRAVSCGVAQLFTQAVITQPVICVEDSSYCNIKVATSSVLLTDSIEKSVYQLVFDRGTSVANGLDEQVQLDYTIINSGTYKALNDLLVVSVYYDQNFNGVVDSSDLWVANDSVYPQILKNQRLQRSFGFGVPSNLTCDLLLFISDSNCVCGEVTIALPSIQVENAGRDTLVCSGSTVTIGSRGNYNNTYSWNNAGIVSEPDSSLTTVLAENTLTAADTLVMVLTTNKGRCSSQDTALVFMHPGMFLQLQDTVQVCKGDRVLIGDPVIGGTGRVKQYQWTPTDSLSKPTGVRTYANPLVSTLYRVDIIDDVFCTIKDSTYVEVIEKPQVDFTVKDTCEDELFTFTNTTDYLGTQEDSMHWDFGGFDESEFAQVKLLLDSAQQFVVQLYASNSIGCWDTTSKVVTVFPNPVAAASMISACEGDSAYLQAHSSVQYGSLSNQWLIAGSSYAKDSFFYLMPFGTELVTLLTATSDRGCTDQVADTFSIQDKPELALSVEDQCFNDTSTLYAYTQAGTVDSISTYWWDLGDGTNASGSSVRHRYADTGNYSIQLIAANSVGCLDTAWATLTTHVLPSADFTIEDVCLGDSSIAFDASNVARGSISQLLWDQGSGFVAGSQQLGQLLAGNGTYTLGLKAVSDQACMDSIYKTFDVFYRARNGWSFNGNCENELITVNAQAQSMDSVASLKWYVLTDSFNTNSFTYNFPASGSFSIRQWLRTNRGCENDSAFSITVDPAPVAVIKADLYCSDNQVAFNSNYTTNYWDLGDGTTSTLQQFNHNYPAIGDYPVFLRVTNSFGCLDTLTQWVNIENYLVPGFSIRDACEEEVQWVINETIGNGVPISSAEFDMGNGDQVNSMDSFTYSYSTAGQYLVSLKVTTQAGCDYDSNYSITIHPLPFADFSIGPEVLDIFSAHIEVKDLSQGADSLVYHLSDGQIFHTRDFEYEFLDSGSYTVKQWVSTQFGCLDSLSKEIFVAFAYKLYIPNAFSPNFDKLNEVFKPTGFGLKSFELQIYNRWGQLVFESSQPNEPWTGASDIPGYYIYKIRAVDFEDNIHQYKGGVYLLR